MREAEAIRLVMRGMRWRLARSKGEKAHQLKSKIEASPCDEPRPGAPSRTTDEQVAHILDRFWCANCSAADAGCRHRCSVYPKEIDRPTAGKRSISNRFIEADRL